MRFALNTSVMLEKCERLQWSVGDFDWDSPGADRVSEAQGQALSGFMTDLYWIESIAAIVFESMASGTKDPVLSSIFASFAKDEQRHADAELELMRRWKIVRKNEIPSPNVNAKNLLRAMDQAAGRVHPAIYSAIIPFTELVLDGALVKHLDDQIEDPLSAHVFRKINADEARHLAVDFHVLELYGTTPVVTGKEVVKAIVHPTIFHALVLGYLPLLFRMKPNIQRLGIGEEQLVACINRYIALGDESPDAARHPAYVVFRTLSRRWARGQFDFRDLLLRLSDFAEAIS
jgi:hypothetical protein